MESTGSVIAAGKERDAWDRRVKPETSPYVWAGPPRFFVPVVNNPTVVELFCGCGGTSKGFEMAGFDIMLGSDFHEPSVETFRHNHRSSAAILGDVKDLSPDEVKQHLGAPPIDVMIAGVPCEGFSLSNRKRWSGDERNYLFREFVRFVGELNPKAVLVENVPGLKSTANGSFVEAIGTALRDAGDYCVSHRVLNAASFGVPQLRRRIFFIGVPSGSDFKWPQPTHGPEAETPYLTVRDAIGDLPALSAGQRATEYDGPPQTEYQRLMRGCNEHLHNHAAPRHQQTTIERIANTKPGDPMYESFRQRIRLSWEQPSPTVVSGGIRPQFQYGHPEQDRGLTVRERCRIQSIPDDFEMHGGMVQGRVQTGDAVPPLLAKAIATSLKDVL